MSGADRFEIRQTRSVGSIVVTIINALVALLFLIGGLALLVSAQAVPYALFLTVFGTLLALLVIRLLRRVGARALVATVDRDGIVFADIKDDRFRRWSWGEIGAIQTRDMTVRGAKIRDLRFPLLPSPRVDEFIESMPRRNIWGSGRKKQLEAATTMRFSVGVRPDRSETISRLSRIAPARFL